MTYRYPKKKWSRNRAWADVRERSGRGGEEDNPFRKAHTADEWCWIENRNGEVDRLRAAIDAYRRDYQALEEYSQRCQDDVQRLTEERDEARDGRSWLNLVDAIDETRADLAAARQRIAELSDDRRASDRRYMAAEERIAELERRLALLCERAVIDFDDRAVGLSNVTPPGTYGDYLREVAGVSDPPKPKLDRYDLIDLGMHPYPWYDACNCVRHRTFKSKVDGRIYRVSEGSELATIRVPGGRSSTFITDDQLEASHLTEEVFPPYWESLR